MNELINWLYWHCTDFCINMANLLGISYIEFNMVLFLILLPSVLCVLLGLNFYRYIWKRIF